MSYQHHSNRAKRWPSGQPNVTGINVRTFIVLCVGLILGTLVSAVCIGDEADDVLPPSFKKHEAALQHARDTGEPVFIIVSATWCGPCKKLKKNINDLVKRGAIPISTFAVVDYDKDRKIAEGYMGKDSSVPQFIALRWSSSNGWTVAKRIGNPSIKDLEAFIRKVHNHDRKIPTKE